MVVCECATMLPECSGLFVVAGKGCAGLEPWLSSSTMTREVSKSRQFQARGGDLLAPVAPACGSG